MNWLSKFLTSSIGKKVLMSLTGLFLCTFLVIHLIGNLQLFKSDGGLAFNEYAVFMTSNPLIKTISYGLYASILFHAFWGLFVLSTKNQKARPVAYAKVDGQANSPWASRWMGVLGTTILVFIVIHMTTFWGKYKFQEMPYTQYKMDLTTSEMLSVESTQAIEVKKLQFTENNVETTVVKDLYMVVADAFKQLWYVLLYVISMAALAFHLVHGFRSAFQTLGINHTKYNGLINFIGVWIFGVLIPATFAAMPVYFYFIQ
jgi:succinate dehydrogenase / fumarate reductase cytochrome b subunit